MVFISNYIHHNFDIYSQRNIKNIRSAYFIFIHFIIDDWNIHITLNLFLSFPILNKLIQCDRNMTVGWIFIVIPFFMLGKTINDHCNNSIDTKVVVCQMGLCLIGLELEILITTILNLHNNVVLCLFTCPFY